jgi:hypothetical protein
MSRYPARISLGERMRGSWFPSLKLKEVLRAFAELLREGKILQRECSKPAVVSWAG